MSFEIRVSKDAAKKLTRVDQPTQARIRTRLQELGQNPYDPRIGKPLVNLLGRWSSRVGATWRIIYRVDPSPRSQQSTGYEQNQILARRENNVVNIDAIQTRGQVYRRI